MNCELLGRHVDAYVDGELDPTAQVDFETHVGSCSGCQERVRFERSVRHQVGNALGQVRAPANLGVRVCEGLDEADRSSLVWRGKSGMALATAAVVLLALGAGYWARTDGSQGMQAAAMPMFEDVVRLHSSELPADVPGSATTQVPQQIVRYFRNKVEFPVRLAEFEQQDVQLVGARLSNVRGQRAAALYYDVGGRRVTVVVFRPSSPVAQGAQRVQMGGTEVLYQDVRGHTVPMRQIGQITYAFTGDLDREALLRLAAGARVRR